MTTFLKLRKYPKIITKETYERKYQANNQRNLDYHAAVVIQSWYKQLRTQRYLRSECMLSFSM